MEILNEVTKIVQKHLENPQYIPNDEKLLAYGMNSLKMINMVVEFEEKFAFEFEEKDLTIENFETIGRMVDVINKYMGELS